MSRLELPTDRPPIGVAAGIVKTETQVNLYTALPHLAAVTMGDFSLHKNIPERLPGQRIFYYDDAEQAAYNAFRLMNPGTEEASPYLPGGIKAAHQAGQLAIVGITALRGEDPAEVLPVLAEWAGSMRVKGDRGPDAIEINGSCPNQGSDDLLCHDAEATINVIEAVRKRIGHEPYLILKVSSLGEAAIRHYKRAGVAVDAIAAINSERGLTPPDPKTGDRVITVADGYAGKSGPAIRSLAERNLCSWLRPVEGPADFPIKEPQYDVISVGGLGDGLDKEGNLSLEDGIEIYDRVHNIGALWVCGAQALYKAPHPGPVAARWAAGCNHKLARAEAAAQAALNA